jgi:hypothetical protein
MMSLRALAPYARRRSSAAGARCELCGTPIGAEHRHLVDTVERSLRCSCVGCALLFERRGQRLRAAPDRWLSDAHTRVGEAAWASLQIPVRLAFFFRPGDGARWAAFYPSPAGATESTLGLEFGGAWEELARGLPLAKAVEPDVEALLVAAGGDGRCEHWLVPISSCYELVGRVKRTWRGFDGGEEARRAIDDFFARVRDRATPLEPS